MVEQRLEYASLRPELVIDRHARDAGPACDRVDRETLRAAVVGQQLARGDDDAAARVLGRNLTLAELIGARRDGTFQIINRIDCTNKSPL